MCKAFGIEKLKTSSYHPETNGKVERSNSTVTNVLSALMTDTNSWDDNIGATILAYNTAISAATGCSPALLQLGKDIRAPYSIYSKEFEHNYFSEEDYVRSSQIRLQNIYSNVKRALDDAAQKQVTKNEYRSEKNSVEFKLGECVFLHAPHLQNVKNSRKLVRPCIGPFRILEKSSPVNYLLKSIANPRRKFLVHQNRMVKMIPRNKYLELNISDEDDAFNNQSYCEELKEPPVSNENENTTPKQTYADSTNPKMSQQKLKQNSTKTRPKHKYNLRPRT